MALPSAGCGSSGRPVGQARSQTRVAIAMGHRDPRMTLRVYTDVTGMRPRTRLGGLLRDAPWADPGKAAD